MVTDGPGGEPAIEGKPRELVFVVDVSGSMATDAKIQSLNAALEEGLPSLRQTADGAVGVETLVRVLTFGTSVEWVVPEPVSLRDFWWRPLEAEPEGLTELGAALDTLTRALDDQQGLLPAIILVTDGMPTDTVEPSFEDALAALDSHPIGRAATRVAVAVGPDADHRSLQAFVAGTGGDVVDARSPEQLSEIVRITGTSLIESGSSPIW